jgi:hypothetical protein
MTSFNTTVRTDEQRSTLPAAVGTFLASLAFIAVGTFGDGSSGSEHGWGEFVFVAGFSAVAVALVFGLAVSRLQASSRAGLVGLILAVLGLLTVVVFWAGVTPALAVGGIMLGLCARRLGRGAGLGTAAVVVGALAVAGYLAIYVGDWMSTNNVAGM